MKKIPLGRGIETLVDDEDWEVLRHFKWTYSQGRVLRSTRNFRTGLKRHITLMHRVILGACASPLQVDHIDGNPLNNQRNNLRLCAAKENLLNKNTRKDKRTCPFKGVFRTKNTWYAKIGTRYLGSFDTAEDAAKAYDSEALKVHGQFARTNKMQGLL